jgi:polyvinyl alcohol dehydrogenase (cytochrome)
MSSGAMMMEASGLTQEQMRAVARYVTGKDFSTVIAAREGRCAAPAEPLTMASGDWNGWGVDPNNSRYQPKPGIAADDVAKLKLKWAFGFPGDSVAYSQPIVVGGRVFVGSAGGNVYSLDASGGCTYWTFAAGAGVRTGTVIAKAKSGKYMAFFGDLGATVHAVDAETGKELWKQKMDDHPAARLTGTPSFYNGRLYVPVSSIEEVAAARADYECCSFRGSLAALDAETGKQIWHTYTIAAKPKPYKKSKAGTQMYGPAGVAIWSSPTVDPRRRLVYASTGDSYTDVEVDTSDAVIAFNMDTGNIVWASQVVKRDNWIAGCPDAPNCPDVSGPDSDFGSSTILRNIEGGKQILIAAQKSGIVWGLDPDNKGKILWQRKVGDGGLLGGIQWGHAADEQSVYAAISDRTVRENGKPGIYALDLTTGKLAWSTPAPNVTCVVSSGCSPGQSSAVSVMPGAVFSGAINGHFRAYSTKTGEILWDYDTKHDYVTVNKVPAKGGSLDSAGPAIAGGMVFTNSGYGSLGGAPGNVLLAFSVDGK